MFISPNAHISRSVPPGFLTQFKCTGLKIELWSNEASMLCSAFRCQAQFFKPFLVFFSRVSTDHSYEVRSLPHHLGLKLLQSMIVLHLEDVAIEIWSFRIGCKLNTLYPAYKHNQQSTQLKQRGG